jgi:RNA polymerase sigma factor (sigma-70 family)
MRPGQLDGVLRHVRSLAALPQTGELSDRELLGRFVAHHDQAAFAAIVERHGPLVLSVCRRVLRREHPAEDACQSTFLVLARKAGTIRKREALGNWLYGVALRVARKLDADARRRSAQEVTEADAPLPDAAGEITWREGLAVLDEELNRLPATYRSALILCYLEGRTQEEAARELGCGPRALCGRLARARESLRRRLVRRGVTLSAALLGALLVSTHAAAALPPALAIRTVRAGVALLSGQALARVAPAAVAALTEEALTAMFVTRAKTVTALALAVGLLTAGAGALAVTLWGEKETPAAGGASAPAPARAADKAADAGPPAAADKKSAAVADDKDSKNEQTIRCVVRDTAGQAITDARVYWTIATTVSPVTSPKALPMAQKGFIKKVVAEGKTDAEGGCELRARLTGDDLDYMSLAAVAPGYGLSGKTHLELSGKGAADQAPLTITLRPEVKIKGRLLTPAGDPAPGVRVRLNSIGFDGGDGVAIDLMASWKIKDSDLPYWPGATTDAEGRFTLDGFSGDADASLTLIHDDFELQDLLLSSKAQAGDGKRLKPEFTHTLAPGRTLQGVVTAADTGKALPGVFLDIQADSPNGLFFGEARTDEQGRYRMPGPAGLSNYQVGGYPPADSGYLALRGGHGGGWPAGATSIAVNFALPRGRLFRGRVLEADTMTPLAGVSITYEPHRDNQLFWDKPYDLVSPVLTDKEGRFTITGLEGEGFVLAEGPSVDYVRTMLPWRKGLMRGDRYLHGYAKVTVPKEGEPAPAEITLRKGVTLEARVLRPDGSPAPSVMAYCRGMDPLSMHSYRWDYGVPFDKGLFRMPGCDPDRTYRVFFLQPELHLGAAVDLKPGAKAAEVRLEPTAGVRGKLVYPDGSAAKDGWAAVRLATTKDAGKLDPNAPGLDGFDYGDRTMGFDMLRGSASPPKPNDGDSFLVEDLIPGAQLYIESSAGGLVVRRPVVLKPGEVKDLGALQLPKAGEKP